MNVRFFAGTRAQYDSLPTPRNQLGLYFCEDTNELFWADRLLTDGMRVIPTVADLPDPSKAADGVVYYVTETRNGYVVPHGTNKWLQTIYAPALDITKVPESEIHNTVITVGAVRDIEAKIYGVINTLDERIANIEEIDTSSPGIKTINFAGVPLEEVNGTFVIDRRCAREALGFNVPEGTEDEELDLITKEYVAEKIAEAELSRGNIDHLATKEELAEAIASIEHPTIELNNYVTKDEIKDLASTTYVDEKVAAIELLKVPTKVSEFENDIGYITATDIPEVNLSNYYNKSETEVLVNDVVNGIIIPDTSNFITMEDVECKGYLTEHQDLSHLTTTDELQEALNNIVHPTVDLTGYATETFVKNAIAEAELNDKDVDLTGYATKDDLAAVESKIPSTEGLVTEQFVLDKIAEIPTDYLKEIPSEYVTETALNKVIAGIEHPSVDLSGYATVESVENLAADVENNRTQLERFGTFAEGLRKDVINLSVATINQKYEVLPFEGALISYADNEVRVNTQHVDIDRLPIQNAGDGSSSTYYYMTFRAYAPDTATSVIEGQSDKMDTAHSELTIDQYGRKYTTIWAAIANKSGDSWTKFGDRSTVDKYIGFYYNFHWYADDKLIGKDRVRVILTNDSCHNDLVPDAVARRIDEKVATIKIPSIDDLATKTYVDETIANIDIPDLALDNYYTKAETELAISEAVSAVSPPNADLSDYALKSDVALKADKIPFTTNKYVTNALGGFVVGESVNGLTVAELFAKLLELSDIPLCVVDEIIASKYGLYQFNDSVEVEKVEYDRTIFETAEEYSSAPIDSTFYQYTYTNDADEVVTESGYQHCTLAQDFIYYMVMLPSSLVLGENVKVQVWSSSRNMWMDTATSFECNPEIIAANFIEAGLEMPEIPEGYTMWVDFSDVNPGNKVRYIIIE